LVLVRSVAASDLRPGDLKLALIEHFRAPMKGNLIRPKEVLEVCQSDFERDFGKCLLDRGYRIRPQVPVGGYAIDFVVEGADDRRLAVELDGDKFHGPERWADDVRRQRALERLGWTFWRCWGSEWISDREGCLADLLETLGCLGIEPIGMGDIDGTYTEHIEVSPLAGDQPDLAEDGAESTPAEEQLLHRERPKGEPPVGFDFAERHLPFDFDVRRAERAESARAFAIEPDHTEGPSDTRSGSERTAQEDTESSGFFEDLDNIVAEVGDLIFIRWDDEPERRLSIRLSSTENKPSEGIVHVSEPLGAAILGACVDEQVTVKIGNRPRIAMIEQIDKPGSAPRLAAE
jgi:very-short-patch-repair endonuclease